MEYNINDVLVLEDNSEYIVVDKVKENETNYLLLINKNESDSDICLVKEVKNEGNIILSAVTDANEFDQIFTKLSQNNKDNLKNLLNN